LSIEINAIFSKLIFLSSDSLYAVAEFIDSQSARRFRATGNVGHLGKKTATQKYKLFGEWQDTPKYGKTFAIGYCEPVRPSSLGGIVPFLANNVKGVGEATAQKLLKSLQVQKLEDLTAICKEESHKIEEFFKGKKKVAQEIILLLTGDESFRQIMVFLHEHEISAKFAQKIFQKYGDQAIFLLKENPYRLITDFRNVGFLKADQVAIKLGIDPTSSFRLEAAFIYALVCACDEGHVCLPRDELIAKSKQVLNHNSTHPFEDSFLLQALRQIYKKNKENNSETFVIRDLSQSETSLKPGQSVYFYVPEYYKYESQVASICASLVYIQNKIGSQALDRIHTPDAQGVSLAKQFPGFPWEKLSKEQALAVELAVKSRLMILTGGPGCGKTFTLKAIYHALSHLKRKIALCAPTGLAAKRMTFSIGVQAFTMHKLLRIGNSFRSQNSAPAEDTPPEENLALNATEDPLEGVDVVIVDEASMISLDLFHTLLQALGNQRRLILVGDKDQLPSVGPGFVLNDLLESNLVPVARLTQIFRQSHESPIPIAAREVIQGQPMQFSEKYFSPEFAKPASLALLSVKSDEFANTLSQFMTHTVPKIYGLDPLRDCQILVPMRRSFAGGETINRLLQETLNPAHPNKKEWELKPGFGDQPPLVLREGDKVIQTKNNYEKDVYNGDLGFCKSIIKKDDGTDVVIQFDDKTVTLEEEDLDDLQLCYAMTIHKSQGSEFKLCVLPMFSAFYSMLDRNLFYTALTRASKVAVVVGEEWAVKKAIKNQNSQRRFTCLKQVLQLNCRELEKWSKT
jgi:exodeoxyribonuclease V alpha subunit